MTAQEGTDQVRFQVGHAADPDWRAATQAAFAAIGGPEPGANLGFVYVADSFADRFNRIVALLRDLSGIAHWIGTVGIGVIGGRTEYFGSPAIAVMVATLPADAFHVFALPGSGDIELPVSLSQWIEKHRPTLGLLHADPRCEELADTLGDLAEATGSFLVGGLPSSETAMPQFADTLSEGGISGVLFGRGVAVATGLSQGCSPIGETHTVTDSIRNIVINLDGRPALDVLRDDAAIAADADLGRALAPIHVALPIPGSDTADYLVRNLIGIDPNAGAVGIAALIDPGGRMMFVRRDPTAAATDLRRMLRGLKARAGDRIAGAVYVSCLARGPNLFGAASREAGIIAEELGDIPLVGFFANGEISNARLYGYTGVLTLFTRN